MGGRAAVAWAYVGLLIALPAGNLVYLAAKLGPAKLVQQLLQPDAVHALILTMVCALLAVLVNTVFGVILALTLARQKFRGRTVVSVLTDVPLTVSPVVAGFVLLVLYRPKGWLGKPLEAAGFPVVNALPAIVLATIFVTVPLVARELTPVLMQIGTEQEDAAVTLGASRWQAFWRITMPSMRHGLTRGMSLTFARAIGEFGAAVVVSGNLIGQTQTMTLWVYQEAGDFNYAGAYAGSLLLGLISIAAFAFAEHARTRSARRRRDLLTHIR